MTTFDDSLRGYGHKIHKQKRNDFVCQYCGADGRKSFDIDVQKMIWKKR